MLGMGVLRQRSSQNRTVCWTHRQEAPVQHRVAGAVESRLGLPAEDAICLSKGVGKQRERWVEPLSAGNCMCNGEGGLMGELLIICPGAEGRIKEKWEHLVDQTNLSLSLRLLFTILGKVGRVWGN